MIFIKSMEINNFQSHEHSIIEFDRGLNVIVGKSDSGKTAIIRALKWVLYNDPPPGGLIRIGSKSMSVKVEFSTGVIVTRLYSNKDNKYILTKANGEEIVLEKFNRTVPKEVIDEIGISKVELGSSFKNAINIAEQLEGPFLLTETASNRASSIGRLIGINFIDDALRDVIKDSKSNNKKIKELEIEKDNLKNQLDEFKYLEIEEQKLLNLKKIRTEILNKSDLINKLNSIKDESFVIDTEINKLNKELQSVSNISFLEMKLSLLIEKYSFLRHITILFQSYKNNDEEIFKQIKMTDKLSNLNKIDDLLIIAESLVEKYNKLVYANSNITETNNRINKGIKYLSDLSHNDENMKILDDLSSKIKLLIMLNRFNNNIILINKDIYSLENDISTHSVTIEKISNQYENIFLELGYCPLCHSKIDKDTVTAHIRGEI